MSYRKMRLAELKQEMARLEAALEDAIHSDYPGLLQWLIPPPSRFDAKRAQIIRWLEEAPAFAARRVSEAYGPGLGPTWYQKHMAEWRPPKH